jgi:hypothetical protein
LERYRQQQTSSLMPKCIARTQWLADMFGLVFV